jgi:preprotein translocase subunit YajC
MTVGMVVILVVLVVFMFRSSRKRQKQQKEQQKQQVVGAHVMTNHGIFGTILSIDEENNKVVLETGNGHSITVHRQAIGRVDSVPGDSDEAPAFGASSEASDAAPKFGERIGDDEQHPVILNGEPLNSEKSAKSSE